MYRLELYLHVRMARMVDGRFVYNLATDLARL